MGNCNGCKNVSKLRPTDIGFLCDYCISFYAKYNIDLFTKKYHEPLIKDPPRKKLKRIRHDMWIKDSTCKLCLKEISHFYDSSIDHIIPISKGGPVSDVRNLQLAHRSCNQRKGSNIYLKDIYLYIYFIPHFFQAYLEKFNIHSHLSSLNRIINFRK